MEAPTITRAALNSELADMLRYLNGTPSEKAAVEAQRCSLISSQVNFPSLHNWPLSLCLRVIPLALFASDREPCPSLLEGAFPLSWPLPLLLGN